MAIAGEWITGSLTGDGRSSVFTPFPNKGFNLYITGTFSATATVQRSFDNGQTWNTVPKPDFTSASFTGPTNMVVVEPRAGTVYSVLVSGFGSGSVDYRFEQ